MSPGRVAKHHPPSVSRREVADSAAPPTRTSPALERPALTGPQVAPVVAVLQSRPPIRGDRAALAETAMLKTTPTTASQEALVFSPTLAGVVAEEPARTAKAPTRRLHSAAPAATASRHLSAAQSPTSAVAVAVGQRTTLRREAQEDSVEVVAEQLQTVVFRVTE